MKIVITQGTTPFAQRIAKQLGEEAAICFASADPVPEVLLRSGNYRQIPAPAHPAFVHELLKSALDREARYLLPLSLEEVLALAGAKSLFSEYGIRILVPDAEVLEEIQVMENPPRQLELSVLDGGQPVGQGEPIPGATALSGVFSISDGGEPFLCLYKTS